MFYVIQLDAKKELVSQIICERLFFFVKNRTSKRTCKSTSFIFLISAFTFYLVLLLLLFFKCTNHKLFFGEILLFKKIRNNKMFDIEYVSW